MDNTWSQGEQLIPYDPEFRRNLQRIKYQGVPFNSISGKVGYGVRLQQQMVGDANNQVQA